MKRIFLFVLTNLAVVVVLGVVASLLGVNRYLTASGLNLTALLGFSLIMGFGGAIISLLISKPVAKWSAGVSLVAVRNTIPFTLIIASEQARNPPIIAFPPPKSPLVRAGH